MSISNFSLPEEEKPLLVTKMHWATYLKAPRRVFVFVVFFGLMLSFIIPLWWESKVGSVGLIISLVIVIVYLLVEWWKIFLTTYIITPCRLIDITQEKLLKRVITEIAVEEVDEIKIKTQSSFEKLVKKGSLIFKLFEEKGILVFYNIPNPENAQKILEELKNEKLEIVGKEKQECSVVVQNNKSEKVPLTYSYFGEKGTIEEKPATTKRNLKLKKKK